MTDLVVKVPDIGDFKDIPVIEIFVKPGDTVKAEDSLVTLESDKATMDVPSPGAGVVKELKVKLGDKVSEGSVIVVLDVLERRLRHQPFQFVLGHRRGPRQTIARRKSASSAAR